MPSVAFITDQLLSMAGLESILHGPPELPGRIISDFNRAIDLIGDQNPQVFYQVRPDQGEFIHAPVTLSVQVVEGAKTITIPSGYDPDWMAGCSILIAGDQDLNRLKNEEATIAPSLEQPYMGTTGTYTATVWHDWIRLPAEMEQIMDPVTCYDRVLRRAQSLTELNNRWINPEGFYDYQRVYGVWPFRWQKDADEAWRWFEVAQTVQGELVPGIMLDALPPAKAKLGFTAKVGITRVTSLQDTRESITPRNKDHEILLPIVRWFFASHMSVSIPKEELLTDFEQAKQSAQSLTIVANTQKRFQYRRDQ